MSALIFDNSCAKNFLEIKIDYLMLISKAKFLVVLDLYHKALPLYICCCSTTRKCRQHPDVPPNVSNLQAWEIIYALRLLILQESCSSVQVDFFICMERKNSISRFSNTVNLRANNNDVPQVLELKTQQQKLTQVVLTAVGDSISMEIRTSMKVSWLDLTRPRLYEN